METTGAEVTGQTTVTAEVSGVTASILEKAVERLVDDKVALANKRAGGSGVFAKDRLRAFIERVERLEEDKKAISDDIKEVYSEAKGEGFDVKIMRQVVHLRKMDKGDFQEWEAVLDRYLCAMGMR